MSSAINRPDIISDDALSAPLILAKNLQEAVKAARDLVEVSKGSQGKIVDAASITEAKDAVNALTLEQQQLVKIQKQIATATAQNNSEFIKETNTLKNLKKELKEKTVLGERDARMISKQNASIEQLGAALAKNRVEYGKLRTESQRTSKEGLALLAVIQKQDTEFKELKGSMGQHQDKVGDYTGALRAMKAELKSAQGEMVSIAETLGQSSPEYQAAAKRAGEIADRIGDAKDEAKAFQGDTSIENIGTRFGLLGDKLKNLDFKGAAAQIRGIGELSKAMTFKEAIAGVGGFGKAMLNLGRIILTNPLFLIASLVAVVVFAIVKLKDSFLPLKIIFSLVGDAVDFLIDQFYALTDAMGLTSHADEEATAKYISNLEKRKKHTEDFYNFFIKLAEARGESTVLLERKRLEELIKLNDEHIKKLEKKAKAHDIVTTIPIMGVNVPIITTVEGDEEAIKQIEELAEANRIMNEEIILLSAKSATEAKKNADAKLKAEKDALFELRKFRLEQAIKTQEEILNSENNGFQARTDAAIKAEQLRDRLVFLIRDKELEGEQNNANKRQLIREQANAALLDNDKKYAEERDRIGQSEIQKQLLVLTSIQNNVNEAFDARVSAAIAAGNLLEENEQQVADRIIAIQNSIIAEEERLFNARNDARQTYYNQQLQQLDQMYSEGLIGTKEYEKRRADVEAEGNAKSVDAQVEYLNAKIEDFKKYGLDTTALEKQLSEVNLETAKQSAEARLEFEREVQTALTDLKDAAVNSALTIIDNFNAAEDEKRAAQLEKLNADREMELELAGNNEARKLEIQQKFALEEDKIKKQQAEADRRRAIFEKVVAATQIGINTAQAIMAAVAALPLTGGLPFSAIAAGIGAAQLAAVLSKPIPKYAHGVDSHPGGLAFVGDGGMSELMVTPSGELLLSPNRKTLVDMEAGTQVFSGRETMGLAMQGLLGSINRMPANGESADFRLLRGDIKQLTRTIKNKKEFHMNFTKAGVEAMVSRAESRQYFLNNFYA